MYRGGPQSTQSMVGEIIAEDRSQLNHDIPNMHKCQYSALRRTAVNSINSGITEEDRSQLNIQQFSHHGGPKSTQSSMTHEVVIQVKTS
ncbi:hypothetical protein E3N88_46046 [Mikania micrantha]|uniref:Uncharacterized protein n=1 Tax=Mikania micrantha TaxID=192012 RepID=A0A5N6L9S0_9ASTR|nr:hypothetical protein E3N88_46046 [Mikania micrantha]